MPQIIKTELISGTPFYPLASMQRNVSTNTISLKTKPKKPIKADLIGLFTQLESCNLFLVSLHSSRSTGYLQIKKKKQKTKK